MEKKKLSLILGIVTVCLWGSLATLGRLVIHLPPFYILGVSFLIGGCLGLRRPKELWPGIKIFLWGVGGFFLYHFLLFYSFRYAPVVESNLINYLWPILMVLLTPLFFAQEKLRFYHYFGGLVAFAGCGLLVSGKTEGFRGENLPGYLMALGAAFAWPLYSLGKKKMPETTVWSVGSFCLGAGVLCFLTHAAIEPRVVLQARDAWVIILMGIGPFGIAFYTWDTALKWGQSKVIGSLAYLCPVLSTLGLVLFTDEQMTMSTFVAMVLIIGGASTGLLDILPLKKRS